MPSGDEYLSQLDDVLFVPLVRHADQRGWLIELYRSDKLAAEQLPMMSYVSQTAPGVARGPHEHAEQTDCFAFIGPGDFKLYLWDSRLRPAFARQQVPNDDAHPGCCPAALAADARPASKIATEFLNIALDIQGS